MYELQCDIESSPGSLERILRLLRVKGFQLLNLQAKEAEHCMRLIMRLKGKTCVDQLISQLGKQRSVLVVEKISATDSIEKLNFPA